MVPGLCKMCELCELCTLVCKYGYCGHILQGEQCHKICVIVVIVPYSLCHIPVPVMRHAWCTPACYFVLYPSIHPRMYPCMLVP